MTARKIKLARLKLTNKKFLEKRLYSIAEKMQYTKNFKDFECSAFFKGELLAELNTIKYRKSIKRLRLLEYRTKELIARLDY